MVPYPDSDASRCASDDVFLSIPRSAAEAALELAELKLRGLAGPAVATLEDLVTNASSEAVRLAGARDLVDRSVGRATERIQVAAAITVKRPW